MAYYLKTFSTRFQCASCACFALLLLSAMAAAADNAPEMCQSGTCLHQTLSDDSLDLADEGGPNMLQTSAWLQRLTMALEKRYAAAGVGQNRRQQGSATAWENLAGSLSDVHANLDLVRATSEAQSRLLQESSRYLVNVSQEAVDMKAKFQAKFQAKVNKDKAALGRDMAVLEKAGLALQEASRLIMGLEKSEAEEFSEGAAVGTDLLHSIQDLKATWDDHRGGKSGASEADASFAMQNAAHKAEIAEKTISQLRHKHTSDMQSVQAILRDAAQASKVILTMVHNHRAAETSKSEEQYDERFTHHVGAIKAQVHDCEQASKAVLLAISDATQKTEDAQQAFKQGGARTVDQVKRLEEKLKEADEQKSKVTKQKVKVEKEAAEAMRLDGEAVSEINRLRALNAKLEAQLQTALTEKSKTQRQMEYMKTQLDLATIQYTNPQEALNMLREAPGSNEGA